jgi:cytidylate kinase
MADVQAVMRAFAQASPGAALRAEPSPRRPTIVISRGMGSGGDIVGKEVARRLGLEYYGREILDAVARQAKVDPALMAKLNEMAAAHSNSWLYATLFGKNVTRDDYVQYLVTTVRGLYRLGGVIMGRGSFIILAGRDVLRVRIYGSLDACAVRVATEDGIDIEAARRKVVESNRKRERFVHDLFDSNLSDPANFDLMVSTDRFPDLLKVADLILTAASALGITAEGDERPA